MYRLDYYNLREASEILYRFMTYPGLTKPECTLWSDGAPLITYTNEGNGFMTEREFRVKLNSLEYSFISCVASTDKEDTRRVTLNVLPTSHYMILNFPSANGNPNKTERALMAALHDKFIPTAKPEA